MQKRLSVLCHYEQYRPFDLQRLNYLQLVLQVPYRRKFKKAEGSSGNSCCVKKAERINHVWSYDFISDQTDDGRKLKILTVLDEFTREYRTRNVDNSLIQCGT